MRDSRYSPIEIKGLYLRLQWCPLPCSTRQNPCLGTAPRHRGGRLGVAAKPSFLCCHTWGTQPLSWSFTVTAPHTSGGSACGWPGSPPSSHLSLSSPGHPPPHCGDTLLLSSLHSPPALNLSGLLSLSFLLKQRLRGCGNRVPDPGPSVCTTDGLCSHRLKSRRASPCWLGGSWAEVSGDLEALFSPRQPTLPFNPSTCCSSYSE